MWRAQKSCACWHDYRLTGDQLPDWRAPTLPMVMCVSSCGWKSDGLGGKNAHISEIRATRSEREGNARFPASTSTHTHEHWAYIRHVQILHNVHSVCVFYENENKRRANAKKTLFPTNTFFLLPISFCEQIFSTFFWCIFLVFFYYPSMLLHCVNP